VQVLAAVQCGDGAVRDRPEQRKVKLVDVEVEDVELIRHLAHAVEHQHVIRDGIPHVGVEAQRDRHATHQVRAGNRIAAGKQRDVVTLPDQFVGKIGNDTLATTIQPRRHALHERRDLCNFHEFLSERTG
jgi:hypothetical protein